MNLVALKTFLSIVENGSLVRASEQLNVTQSTVTARLKTLEQELGRTLVHRHKSGATLTAAGLKLKRYAEAMTDLWRQARQETSLPSGVDATCKFGCEADLWPHFGQRLFTQLYKTQTNVALSVQPGIPGELENWLASGIIDFALSYQPLKKSGLHSEILTKDTLIVVGDHPGRPLAFDTGYIYVEGGEAFGRRHTAAYSDAGIARLNFGSAIWALDHLLEHGGSAYLPQRMVSQHLNSGKLHHLAEGPAFLRNIYVVRSEYNALPDWLAAHLNDLAAG